MDWNDPDELRRLHDLLDDEPTTVTTIEGPNGPVTDTVEMLVGRLGMPDTGGSYFTFSNENNDLIWGFLAECHRRGWLYKGHDTMPWCGRCGTGLSQMELNEGYQDREDPGLDRPLPADRPPRRGAARLDDDALDAHLERRGGRRGRPALRPRPPGRGPILAGEGDAQDRAPGPVRGGGRGGRHRPRRLGVRGPVRRAAGRAGRLRRGHPGRPVHAVSPSRGRLGRGRRGRGDRHRPHRPGLRRRGLPAGQVARAAGDRADRRIGDRGRGVRVAVGPRRPRRRRADRRASQARGPVLPPRAVPPPLPALLALRDAAALPPRRRVVHQHGPGLRPAARDADPGAGRREPALPDHGRGRHHRVDPRVRAGARARLAAQHARLDDQQEALLGPRAADLRLLGVRDHRGHRRPRRAARAGGRAAGRASRATRRIGPGSTA